MYSILMKMTLKVRKHLECTYHSLSPPDELVFADGVQTELLLGLCDVTVQEFTSWLVSDCSGAHPLLQGRLKVEKQCLKT